MNLNELYTQVITENSRSKENRHPVENATHSLEGVNPSCGDDITLQLRVKDGKIEDAGFIGTGCAISQASASLMIDLVKGRTVEDARRLIGLYFDMIKGKITPEQLDDLEDDGTVVCVFNGEIYNFMDLRTELQAKGHIFKTHCDTEVIIHGYEEYGTALAAKLRGMFAFVVWDTKTNEMYGARDIFGIKPFYYTQTDAGELLFGSEIKSLLGAPRFPPRGQRRGTAPLPDLPVQRHERDVLQGHLQTAPPAHWFTYKDGQMQIERYWDVDFRHPTTLSYEAAADEIDARVRESVAAHRISDVKVGSFLSGGVDSSYITACLMPDETFSVGFASPDGTHKFDETTEAGELSQKLGIKNYREMLTKEQCLDAFADIQYHMDEPQSNPSSVPSLLPVPAGPSARHGRSLRRGR